MPHRLGKIAATIVGAVLIFMGVAVRDTRGGPAAGPIGVPGWAIAGAILIGSVLIASALPGPPPRPPKPQPPHPLD